MSDTSVHLQPPPKETLTIEFKSEPKSLNDDELVEALVCLANAEGGKLWLGVEDDGTAMRMERCNSRLIAVIRGYPRL